MSFLEDAPRCYDGGLVFLIMKSMRSCAIKRATHFMNDRSHELETLAF